MNGPECGAGSCKNSWDGYDTVFLNSKAGMDGVDKKKVQKVVYEMSKGSRYFDKEQRKEAVVQQRVQTMRLQAANLNPAQLAAHEKEADLKILELEVTRDLSRVWLHVDMDAFYAAVETLENPTLAGKPMAVGGMSMICTANYEARKFGVRAAMPGFIARKLCSDLLFVRPDFEKYARYSELSRKVFSKYDPNFVARSLDEAFLDITDICRVRDMDAVAVAEELRKGVHEATGLTCSAGVGPNRLLAKVCSDINKPNGQFVLSNDRTAVMAFVSSLPIRKVSGIGKVTERLLKEVLGITVCADLLRKRSHISALFSQISRDFFLGVALGVGGSEPVQEEPRKSLSTECTFGAISKDTDLFNKLEELAGSLEEDMQKEGLQGRTLTLKLKTTEFEVRTRAVTLPSFIHRKEDILVHSLKLLKRELPISVRLMGLRMSHFKGERTELADRGQRTLASFLSRSPASESWSRAAEKKCMQNSLGARDGSPDLHDEDDARTDSDYDAVERDSSSFGSGHVQNTEDFPTTKELLSDPTQSPGKSVTLKGQQTLQAFMHSHHPFDRDGSVPKCQLASNTCVQYEHPSYGDAGSGGCVAGGARVFETGEAIDEQMYMSELNTGGVLLNSANTGPSGLGVEQGSSEGLSLLKQRWVDDNSCSICGIRVNADLLSTRQEHEDFHLAVTLQQQYADLSSSIRPAQQNRHTKRELLQKRKLSGAKVEQNVSKKSRYIPIDTFFGRLEPRPSDENK